MTADSHLFFGSMYLSQDEQKAYDAYIQQDYVSTIKFCQLLLSRNPEHRLAIDLSAKSLFHLGKYDGALQGMATLLKLLPNNGDVYGFRGWIHLAMGKSDLALEDLNTAIRLGVSDPVAYYQRSVVYYRQKRFLEALADMNYVMTIWQPLPSREISFRIQRGLIHHRLENFAEAIVDYSQVIELEPDNRTAWINRAWTYSVSGNFEQSNADVEKAISLAPESPYPYGTLGHTCFLTDRLNEALKHFTKQLELKPDSHRFAIVGQAVVQHALGNLEAAKIRWRELIELDARYETVDVLMEFHPAEAFIEAAQKLIAEL